MGKIGATVSSNLTASISSDDVFFDGALTLNKSFFKEGKKSRLMFGFMYNTVFGEQRLLPLIGYMHMLNKNWSYSIGFPKTYIQYRNTRNSWKMGVDINGFQANLSNPVGLYNTDFVATKAIFATVSAALEYNYKFTPNWITSFKVGYSFSNTYKLKDKNNNTVYNFDFGSRPYFSMGLKYNIN